MSRHRSRAGGGRSELTIATCNNGTVIAITNFASTSRERAAVAGSITLQADVAGSRNAVELARHERRGLVILPYLPSVLPRSSTGLRRPWENDRNSPLDPKSSPWHLACSSLRPGSWGMVVVTTGVSASNLGDSSLIGQRIWGGIDELMNLRSRNSLAWRRSSAAI